MSRFHPSAIARRFKRSAPASNIDQRVEAAQILCILSMVPGWRLGARWPLSSKRTSKQTDRSLFQKSYGHIWLCRSCAPNKLGDLEPLLLPPERLSCVIEAHQFHQICHQLFSKRARIWYSVLGGMAEWTIAAVLKTAEPKAPGVRIPLPPLAAMEPVSSLATKMNRGDTYGGGYLD